VLGWELPSRVALRRSFTHLGKPRLKWSMGQEMPSTCVRNLSASYAAIVGPFGWECQRESEPFHDSQTGLDRDASCAARASSSLTRCRHVLAVCTAHMVCYAHNVT
jgi:hypothetical protein